MNRCTLGLLVAIVLIAGAASTNAADLYWDGGATDIVVDGNGASNGGAGTWDTAILNWDQGASAHVAWPNTNADKAIFGGTGGAVDLGSDITLNQMQFDVTAYSIGTSDETKVLDFGGTTPQITLNSAATNTYIYAGITGSPKLSIGLPDKNHSYLVPNVENMTLGHVTYTRMGSRLHLGGATSGNSLASFSYSSYATIIADGSGTWTVGDLSGPGQVELYVKSGNLIANGTLDISFRYFQIQGGVFHYNNAAAVAAPKKITMRGGDLDNSSGAAIVSTTNHAMDWNGDFTFIGSKGANSDLNVGTGAVAMNNNRIVTVQNAATTLTVGGAIGDGANTYGLTKAGPGTLALNGVNTYTGMTTVAAGTLGGTATLAGAVTVQPGGTIAPGGSIGTLNATQLTWNSDDALAGMAFELSNTDATSDLLNLSGDFTKGTGSSFLFDFIGGTTGNTYTLVNFAGTNFSVSDLAVGSGTSGTFILTGNSLQFAAAAGLPGDANGNGFVDDDDLAILLSNWEQDPGTITTWALGDFTDDTDVDDDDLAVLLGNWTGSAPGGAAVPEPATLALLGLGGLTVLRRRRK